MKNRKVNALEKAKEEISDIIQLLNSTTACFTGHRSQKLPWRFNEEDERRKTMKNTLRHEIEKAIERGYRTFLCGMALGFDTLCAETVLELKESYTDIKITGALPCRTQDKKGRQEIGRDTEISYLGWTIFVVFTTSTWARSVCWREIGLW